MISLKKIFVKKNNTPRIRKNNRSWIQRNYWIYELLLKKKKQSHYFILLSLHAIVSHTVARNINCGAERRGNSWIKCICGRWQSVINLISTQQLHRTTDDVYQVVHTTRERKRKMPTIVCITGPYCYVIFSWLLPLIVMANIFSFEARFIFFFNTISFIRKFVIFYDIRNFFCFACMHKVYNQSILKLLIDN